MRDEKILCLLFIFLLPALSLAEGPIYTQTLLEFGDNVQQIYGE